VSRRRARKKAGGRRLAWVLAVAAAGLAAAAWFLFARPRSATLPVPGRATAPAPRELIRPDEKGELERVLRERGSGGRSRDE
jgi:hypothetical protein